MAKALNVIIVENDFLIAMDLADLMIGMGHDVQAIARTETEAVSAALRFQPDLMIVACNLEESNGVVAMGRILARGFVPHLNITGDSLLVCGPADDAVVVAKPFNLPGLRDGITRARRRIPGGKRLIGRNGHAQEV